MRRKQLAEEYLEVLEFIRNAWAMGNDARHYDVRRRDLYREMLEETGKTEAEYPNARQLAYDIIDGKV